MKRGHTADETSNPSSPSLRSASKAVAAATIMSKVPRMMKDYHPFPQKANHAIASAASDAHTPQTASSAYKLAWADDEFLHRDDLRPLRLQLEYTKPEKVMQDHDIDSTIVVFGSARIRDIEQATAQLKAAEQLVKTKGEKDEEAREKLRVARRMVDSVKYYDAAQELGRIVTEHSDGNKLVVITGGGPGIMEAANRGASEVPDGRSVGLNIVLPFEQRPNPYITPELCFNFHYFSMRKMHFLGRARALVAFPGGWGTMDELFEALTLIQTKKMAPIPVILFSKAWWERIVNFDSMLDEGVISKNDFTLFKYAETAQEAWGHITAFYKETSKNVDGPTAKRPKVDDPAQKQG